MTNGGVYSVMSPRRLTLHGILFTGRLVTTLGIGVMLLACTVAAHAQNACPAEIGKAKELLQNKGGLRAEETAPPSKSLAGSRQGEQVAGTQWTGRLVRASRLVSEAEAACKVGDVTTAKARAEAAIAELQ
jgi:hypothetical protein